MISFEVGKKSDGSLVIYDLCNLPNLFVSYQTHQEFMSFINAILNQQFKKNIESLLIYQRKFPINTHIKNETFIYNDPESGTIKNFNKLFITPIKTFKKTKNNKDDFYNTLIIIDDIWQIVPKLKKRSANQFKQLLNEGSAEGIHFIIGSSLPYRNLLLQLMANKSEDNKSGVINQIGAEMIFNIDGLIFFREKNNIAFQTYYP